MGIIDQFLQFGHCLPTNTHFAHADNLNLNKSNNADNSKNPNHPYTRLEGYIAPLSHTIIEAHPDVYVKSPNALLSDPFRPLGPFGTHSRLCLYAWQVRLYVKAGLGSPTGSTYSVRTLARCTPTGEMFSSNLFFSFSFSFCCCCLFVCLFFLVCIIVWIWTHAASLLIQTSRPQTDAMTAFSSIRSVSPSFSLFLSSFPAMHLSLYALSHCLYLSLFLFKIVD